MNIKKIMSIVFPAGIGFVAGMLTSEAVMKISTLTKKELTENSEESDTIEDDDELQTKDFIVYPDEEEPVEEKKTVLDAVDEIDDDDEDYLRYKQERNRRQIEKMKEAKKYTVIEYNNILKSNGYKTESQDDDIIDDDLLEIEEEYENPEPDEYDVTNTDSFVISPDEYMTVSGYTSMSLIYHSDDVITDEEGSVIEDPDATLMPDIKSHFGEYELDTVYIRNESRQVEYEILWDDEPFGEET